MFDETKTLWTDYLEGELSSADEERLVKALDSGDAARRYVLKDLESIGMLRQLGVSNEGFIRSLGERMRSQNEGFSFLLDTARRLEIEKDAKPRRSSGKRIHFPLAIGMAVAAGIAIIAMVWTGGERRSELGGGRSEGEVLVSASSGRVWILRGDDQVVARTGDFLLLDDRLRTGAGIARIEYDDGTTIRINHESEVRFSGRGGRKTVELMRGSIACDVTKQRTGRGLRVVTCYATSETLGTRFGVRLYQDRVRLSVEEGEVSFVPQKEGEIVAISAGMVATSSGTGKPTVKSFRRPFAGPVGSFIVHQDVRPILKMSSYGLAYDGANIWIGSYVPGRATSLYALDAISFDIVHRVEIRNGMHVWKIVFGDDGSFWAVIHAGSFHGLAEMDPFTGKILRKLSVSGVPALITYGDGSLWVFMYNGRIDRVNPVSGKVTHSFDSPVSGISASCGMAYAGDALWLRKKETLYKVDPRNGSIMSKVVVNHLKDFYCPIPGSIASDGQGNMWLLSQWRSHEIVSLIRMGGGEGSR